MDRDLLTKPMVPAVEPVQEWCRGSHINRAYDVEINPNKAGITSASHGSETTGRFPLSWITPAQGEQLNWR
jgi:hypothetical protein